MKRCLIVAFILFKTTTTINAQTDTANTVDKIFTVVEKEAKFKGGEKGWVKYLQKNLNANVANDVGAPAGLYTVKVQFNVSKEGIVTNVKAIEIPAKCKPCASEAVRVIAESDTWEPAFQNNRPVNYIATQAITFQVVDSGKKN